MPERRPLAIFGRYVQILPGADITAVQEALGFFLGPYFPHNAWLLCRSALHEMTASWTFRARWPRIHRRASRHAASGQIFTVMVIMDT